MFFSAIAGGALMAQNLREVGQPAARVALWGSIAYTGALMLLSSLLPAMGSGAGISLVTGYVGALGLEAYFKKFIADRSGFPVKGIGWVLAICLVVFGLIVGLLIYSLTETRS